MKLIYLYDYKSTSPQVIFFLLYISIRVLPVDLAPSPAPALIPARPLFVSEPHQIALILLHLTSPTSLPYSHYGAQAVVVSVDPKRVYVHSPSDAPAGNVVVHLSAGAPPVTGGASALQQDRQEHLRGPEGQEYCWWQVTVKGGREARDLDAITFAKVITYPSIVHPKNFTSLILCILAILCYLISLVAFPLPTAHNFFDSWPKNDLPHC